MIPQILTRLRSEPWALTQAGFVTLANQLHRAESALERFTMPRATLFETGVVGPVWCTGEPLIPQLEVFGRCAVVHVNGVLANGVGAIDAYFCEAYDYAWLCEFAEQAAAIPGVKNLLVNWNSPGGSVVGLEEAAARLDAVAGRGLTLEHYSARLVASAAYRLTLNGRLTVAQSAQVGCVGSILSAMDSSQAAKSAGYEMHVFTSDGLGNSAPLKSLGVPFTPITDQQKQFLQGVTHEAARWFRAAVDAARPDATGPAMLGGWDFGKTAVANGIADDVIDQIEQLVAILA